LRERSPGLARELEKVEMLPLLSATCFFPASSPSIEGFGCLFPRSEGFRALGVLANDRIFPGRALPGWRSETWIFGGATDPAALGLSDDQVLGQIESEYHRIHGKRFSPEECYIRRWPQAIPHYNLSLEKLGMRHEGNYTLFGTYLGDLGLARVLFRARELARSFR
jgi:oxygen-dependent protoporphyrinogen oxidase